MISGGRLATDAGVLVTPVPRVSSQARIRHARVTVADDTDNSTEESLYDVFGNQNYIKLPVRAMRDCGPAAETLGAMLRYVTDKETFTSAKKIAEALRLPLTTYRRHANQLASNGYLKNVGRENGRRSATIRILKKARTAADTEWGVLPSWARRNIRTVYERFTGKRNTGQIPWSAKAVLSIVMARLAGLRSVVNPECWVDGEELWAGVEYLGGHNKFQFSLPALTSQTGLHRESIIEGKNWLREHGLVDQFANPGRNGGSGRDSLMPSPTFRIKKTPIDEKRCYLDFVHSEDWS